MHSVDTSTPDDSVNNTNPSTVAQTSKRNGGRKRNGAEAFSTFETDPNSKTKRVKFICCPHMKSIAWNPTRAMKHLLDCQSFKDKFPADFEDLVRKKYGDAAANAEESRRSREILVPSSSRSGFRPSRTESFSENERIDRYFPTLTTEKKEKLDRTFADAIINDGVSFNFGSSPNWEGFWKCAFGSAWRPPYRQKISGELLDSSFNEKQEQVIEALSNIPALGISVDGFTDINSKSVFNLMAGAPLPFVVESFRLHGKKESAANLDKKISSCISSACDKIRHTRKAFGFCSDSPNVMKATRSLLCGGRDGGSNCVVFAYGCLCHALSNLTKDICKEPFVKEIITKTIQIAQLFRNTHVAGDLLSKAREKQDNPPQTIKSYSTTRWNGVAVLCQSVLANKELIGSVLASQRMMDPSERDLDLSPRSKASKVMEFATEGSYWKGIAKIAPLFSLINYLVTFLESDTAPLSYALLSFSLIYESLDMLSLPIEVVNTSKESIKSRFNSIQCDVHALSVVLDPLVPKTRWFSFNNFYSSDAFNNAARRAFEKCCSWLELSSSQHEKSVDQFQMILADRGTIMKRCTKQASSYHPQLWWSIDSTSEATQISNVAQAVFSIFLSGSGNERSFKTRSRLHTKTRNRMSNDKADKQAFIVFNNGQIQRVNSALNTHRTTVLDFCLTNGLNGEKGKELLQIVGLQQPDDKLDDSSNDVCCVLLDVVDLEAEFEALLKI